MRLSKNTFYFAQQSELTITLIHDFNATSMSTSDDVSGLFPSYTALQQFKNAIRLRVAPSSYAAFSMTASHSSIWRVTNRWCSHLPQYWRQNMLGSSWFAGGLFRELVRWLRPGKRNLRMRLTRPLKTRRKLNTYT
jgi:hypothetical protein